MHVYLASIKLTNKYYSKSVEYRPYAKKAPVRQLYSCNYPQKKEPIFKLLLYY